jgi:ferredoxin--NADP+ reductase
VIGNGNVALDVARVLAKSDTEMAKSDIVPEAGAAIAAAPIEEIAVVGRRGPEHASFTSNELAEMGRLLRAVAVSDPKALDVTVAASDPTPERLRKTKNLDILKGFANNQPGAKPVTVRFLFNAAPVSIGPKEIELTTGKLAADLVVTCIGYTGVPYPTGEGVFPVGWAKRGPTGTIPTNRSESHAVAKEVMDWLNQRDPKSGPDPMPLSVDLAGWHRIDKAEVAAGAKTGRPRVKLTEWQQLLDVAQGD